MFSRILKSAFVKPATAAVIGIMLNTISYGQDSDLYHDSNSFERIHHVPAEGPFPAASYLSVSPKEGAFALVEKGVPASILLDGSDHPGVLKMAEYFRKDLGYVSGSEAERIEGEPGRTDRLIIIGTLHKNKWIDQLIVQGKIETSALEGKWEQFLIIPVKNPVKGVKNGLVIAGSDKRGTIYGMFELSRQMGVSPWYWWADAPVKTRKNIYVRPGTHSQGEPGVKYRGIFINDEDPALAGWVREKFGDFNHLFYEKVFELILRMRGNYLWPAMWGKSLWDDDSLSAPLADEMGVVLATSHHEPLMRSHVEWNRYGQGDWNYETNAEELRQFWREGMERTKGQEKVVTLAMRGDGDAAMSDETNIELLEKIVSDQRKIIEEVTGRPAEETPQVWALYKEVQDYYDKGMRVPEDVTLLLCDDNWGDVRILPAVDATPRAGGYGMYYHFDFVGGPRSYKWLNTVQIERTWEQMRLTYQHGVREIWLVNVGDLKPMELPISFFLDYAWDPDAIAAKDLPGYYTAWADAQFGGLYPEEIGKILALYTKYNARRKPELLEPSTYSLTRYREADRVVEAYQALVHQADSIRSLLQEASQDAFFQLVQYPVEACANLNEMYVAAAKNRYYGMQNRASTNAYADRVIELFFKDADLTRKHHTFADGKWNHIMNQTHMGFVSWSDPAVNRMPEVSYIQVPAHAGLGYVLENGKSSFRWNRGGLYSRSFSPFDPVNDQRYYLELFNTGSEELTCRLNTSHDWIRLSDKECTVQYERKIYVSVDWDKVPEGQEYGEITFSGNEGREFKVRVPLRTGVSGQATGFIEDNGVVSIDAVNFRNSVETATISWETIPNLGRTGSAVTTIPVTASRQTPGPDTPYLEYGLFLPDTGTFILEALFSPTLNFQKDEGLEYAFSLDDGPPRIMNLHENAKAPDWTYPGWWNNAVSDNIMKQTVWQKKLTAGRHTLRYHMVDPGLVLQKIILRRTTVEPDTYLGPPQSTLVE